MATRLLQALRRIRQASLSIVGKILARSKASLAAGVEACRALPVFADHQFGYRTPTSSEHRTRRGWIAVDLDGTLAQYRGWYGINHIGEPVPAMVSRVKEWLDQGIEVRIFTARVSRRADRRVAVKVIGDWCEQQGLPRLPVTNVKDFGMIELWDDRAVRVQTNMGERADAA